MLADAKPWVQHSRPHMALVPGFAIIPDGAGAELMATGLRDRTWTHGCGLTRK